MAATMTDVRSLFGEALELARRDGDIIAPTGLLNLLKGHATPIEWLPTEEGWRESWQALEFGFPLPRMTSGAGEKFREAMLGPLAGLIRWILHQVEEWHPDELGEVGLGAIFAAAAYCGSDKRLWDHVGEKASVKLIERLEALVSSLRGVFSAPPELHVPIYEQEIVDKFLAADRAKDWAGLLDRLPSIDPVLRLTPVLHQVVTALATLSLSSWLRSVSDLDSFSTAIILLRAIPEPEMAVQSDNPYIDFALIHLSGERRGLEPDAFEISGDQLTDLLVRSASDHPLWSGWMAALNRYPVRYPRLQAPLGRALAAVSDDAIETYLLSIPLDPNNEDCRLNVSLALQAFRAHADADQRKRLWAIAYRIWADWDFGGSSGEPKLVSIGRSALDVAITGYALECLEEAEIDEIIRERATRIAGTTSAWFASQYDFQQAWRRALSSFQPFAHARSIRGTAGEWLQGSTICLPFDPARDRYAVMASFCGDLVR